MSAPARLSLSAPYVWELCCVNQYEYEAQGLPGMPGGRGPERVLASSSVPNHEKVDGTETGRRAAGSFQRNTFKEL